MKSYKDLDIYTISFDLFITSHMFTMKLPKYEMYELGSQIRRSADSVNSNIVEGYGRRAYKQDYLKFLTYSHASNLEVYNHLEKIAVLYPDLAEEAQTLGKKYDALGIKINNFINYVTREWR
jgi:four helix bundle protein